MKPPKPGQYWSPDHIHIVRAIKRTNGCEGCLYKDNIILCPGVRTKNGQSIDCSLLGVIFCLP